MGQKYTSISDLYKQVKLNERDIIERKLTSQELEDRERIAKKLPMADFKKRYGKDAMAVKMAVATNMAKAKNETDTSTRKESEARKALWNAEKEISELQKIQSENEKKISEVNTLVSVQREALIRVTNDINEAESQVEEIFSKSGASSPSCKIRAMGSLTGIAPEPSGFIILPRIPSFYFIPLTVN